jgi:ApeA N-terminal domain 1
MQNWLKNYNDFVGIIDIINILNWSKEIHVKTAFIHLLQAAESVHYRVFETHIVSEEEYKEIQKHLYTAVKEIKDSSLRGEIKSRIKFGNRKNLSIKLNDILDVDIMRIFGIEDERINFIQKIVTTRNYLTHLEPKYRKEVLTGKQLAAACRIIQMGIYYQFLLLLGLSKSKILSVLIDSTEVSNTRRNYLENLKSEGMPIV